jgi:para-aminobenzoate synthetase/4-amino-4-deoxychorismate lyase
MGGFAGNNALILRDSGEEGARWLSFENPQEIVVADSLQAMPAALAKLRTVIAAGLHVAGFVSYEAASAFDKAMLIHALDNFPCLWFGVYAAPRIIELPQAPAGEYELGEWAASVSWSEYETAIVKIKGHIQKGDSYQINFTHKLRAGFEGDPWALFLDLNAAQKSEYAAYIDTGDFKVLSVSPELFFRLDGTRLVSKPMKGTVSRGASQLQDIEKRNWLHDSSKNRAENLMIVDMIRNDIAKIAVSGSVSVPRMFDIEKYPTLHQMTSTVTAETHADVFDILRAMFPCASITGAPKIKTMSLINELEKEPRGVYTGAIGYIGPTRRAQFNVAIRTVVIDSKKQSAEYGVGGGIVWDSEADAEYRECRTKAAVLARPAPDFKLLESMLWIPGDGIVFREDHLQRLSDSADYFDFEFPAGCIDAALDKYIAGLSEDARKIRLTLSNKAKLSVESAPLLTLVGQSVGLSTNACDTQIPWCCHKTTHREIYEKALAARPDCDDVILWNKGGHITETTICNIVMLLDGEYLTPHRGCGLLEGVFRNRLLQEGVIKEAIVRREMLRNAQAVYLVNSVRGWLQLKALGDDSWIIKQELPILWRP